MAYICSVTGMLVLDKFMIITCEVDVAVGFVLAQTYTSVGYKCSIALPGGKVFGQKLFGPQGSLMVQILAKIY